MKRAPLLAKGIRMTLDRRDRSQAAAMAIGIIIIKSHYLLYLLLLIEAMLADNTMRVYLIHYFRVHRRPTATYIKSLLLTLF